MKRSRIWIRVLSSLAVCGGLALVLVLDACSTQNRRAAFDFFFDPEEVPQAPVVVPERPVQNGSQVPVISSAMLRPADIRFTHEPFVKRECVKCHASKFSENLVDPVPALCIKCHKDWTKGREPEEIHKPVRLGKCMKCHLPHQGPVTNLLKAAGAEFCYNCHDDWAEGGKTVIHKPVTQGKCLSCHTPHASEFIPLLAKAKKELCVDCHKPYTKQFVHKPVTEGKCLTCHATHSSKLKGLVKRDGHAMCDDCHDPEEMAKVAKHKGTEQQDCAGCHEMHDSNLAHLMKASSRVVP